MKYIYLLVVLGIIARILCRDEKSNLELFILHTTSSPDLEQPLPHKEFIKPHFDGDGTIRVTYADMKLSALVLCIVSYVQTYCRWREDAKSQERSKNLVKRQQLRHGGQTFCCGSRQPRTIQPWQGSSRAPNELYYQHVAAILQCHRRWH